DLNSQFQLSTQWLILGEQTLVLAEKGSSSWNSKSVSLKNVGKVREVSGLSYQKLIFEDSLGEILLSVNYSLRQSGPMSSLKFFVEQHLNKESEVIKLEENLADKVYINQLIEPIVKAQSSISGTQTDVVWRLLGLLKPYRKSVILGMSGAVLMTLVSLIPAYLTGFIIDEVVKPFQAGQMSYARAKELTYITLGGLVVIYICREFFAWLRLRKMTILGELVAKDLRDKVYSHLQKLSLKFFNSKQTGSIISRVGSDTDRIWDFIAFGVVEVTTSLIMLTGLSSVLIDLDWRLGLLVSLPVPLLMWIIYKHGQSMQKLFLRAWRKWSNLTDCLSDTIPGIKVVKSFNKEDEEVERFQSRNSSVVKEFNNIHIAWTKFWPFLMLTIQAIVIGVWAFGMPRVLDHIEMFNKSGQFLATGVSPGVFVSFVLYLGMFVQPIEIIGQMSRMINRATSSAHRVFEILDTEPQIINTHDAKVLANFSGKIEFKDVIFSYDGVRKILKGVNFTVHAGEMIGLVGPSGSGKTTITNLISRFFDVNSGEVLIDGVNIKNLELNTYRQHLGIVLQDPYLFHGTLLENIRYAYPEASYTQVIEAAKAANAHDFICKLPSAYDTVVG
ncbi:MAG: ABC transporter ATP-binding protein, partial [Bdellovibrionales bacterium]|nr:ABC transporter ATP-binding protein [Bdellovibrionales bacterium]